jgi:hypothetical protein
MSIIWLLRLDPFALCALLWAARGLFVCLFVCLFESDDWWSLLIEILRGNHQQLLHQAAPVLYFAQRMLCRRFAISRSFHPDLCMPVRGLGFQILQNHCCQLEWVGMLQLLTHSDGQPQHDPAATLQSLSSLSTALDVHQVLLHTCHI